MKGYIRQIETMGIHDGPGIRTVFFLQGCPLRCLYCHNPEMLERSKEEEYEYTPEQVLSIALQYKNYYGEDGGVTFSGGEPLLQTEFLIACISLLKEHDIHTVLDTSGGVIQPALSTLLELVDLVIYDVKAVEQEEYEAITNFKQEITIQFLERTQAVQKPLWIRQVIVPGINDTLEHMDKLTRYVSAIQNIKKIELLPYHTFGTIKYERLKLKYPLNGTPAMDVKRCVDLENYLFETMSKIELF